MDDRMEGFDAADIDVVQDAGRNKDVVQSFGVATVRVRFSLDTVVTGVDIDQVALSHEVADAIWGATKAFVEISAKDDLGTG